MKLSDLETFQINQALFSLVNAYHRRAAEETSPSGLQLTVAERGMLLVLGQLQPVNLRRLAEMMQINAGPASQYVQRLVEKGLVERERDQTDRRTWWLRLSTSGRQAYTESMQGALLYTRDMLSSLDEPEQRQFYTLLLHLSRALGYNW